MKVFLAIAVAVFIASFATSASHADVLILSPRLKLTYTAPSALLHTQRSLVLKYDDWHLSHEIVDPSSFYPKIDLTGVAEEFIKAIFDKNLRSGQQKWLALLAEEQAEAFGIKEEDVLRAKAASADIIGFRDAETGMAQIFIFDAAYIHHIQLRGSDEHFRKTILNIGVR